MSELEHSLAALAAEIDWPEAPELELRIEPAPRPARRPRRRGLVVAIAVTLVAIGIAFAVPPARSAILDFFHLGGVTVERVTTLPEAEERPLAADLGAPITPAAAELVLGAPVDLPDSEGEPRLYQRDGIVSTILAAPDPVLFSVFRPQFNAPVLKKLSVSSLVEHARIDDETEGLWIAGEQHVIFWQEAPPRLAGNALVWERDGLTYRLEGEKLTKERALELARQVGG